MKKDVKALVAVILIFAAFYLTGVASARTWYVDAGGSADFMRIQDAINVANESDTIFVYNGTYIEHLSIDKNNLTILGEDRNTTIIDGYGYEGDVVTVEHCTTNCTVNGFTINNSGVSNAGIATECSAYYINISNNILKNNYYGVLLLPGSCCCVYCELCGGHNNIIQNIIYNNNGAGISVDSTDNFIAHNNIFSNDGPGISIYSDNNTISDNNISYNGDSNIALSGSKNNIITNNTIIDSSSGCIEIASACYYNTIINNTIVSTYEGVEIPMSLGGISIKSSNHNYVIANTFNKNYGAIRLKQANYNLIRDNNILNNKGGIGIKESHDNLVYHNNLINNSEPASDDDSNSWDNGYPSGGNYWSNYTGVDEYNGGIQDQPGSDGIGDTPYLIPDFHTPNAAKDKYPFMIENGWIKKKKIDCISLWTDRGVYGAREEMNVFLLIFVSENISESLIEIRGILSNKGVYYASYSTMTDLVAGENLITFAKTLPSCTKCAGIEPGAYFINASLTYDDEIVIVTHSIVIVSEPYQRNGPNEINGGDVVFIGEHSLKFDTNGDGVYGDKVTGDVDFILEGINCTGQPPISVNVEGWTVPHAIEGKYTVKIPDDIAGGLNDGDEVYIDEATITGDVILNTAAQDSIVGKSIPSSSEIVFKVQTNIGTLISGGKVEIQVIDPDGVEVTDIDGLPLNDIIILAITTFVGNPMPTTAAPAYGDALDLDGMTLGTYRVTFKLNKTSCNSLDPASVEMEFKIMSFFDTGIPFTRYPSISGIHNGTITPSYDINVTRLYTYPCAGTGGHTEYVKIWKGVTPIAEKTWSGYLGDWHNITFDESFTLYANETYNYTIRTGSYPQIIHAPLWNATGGVITCSEFLDVNGKPHEGGIPAIRLFSTATPTSNLTITKVIPSEFNPGETSEVRVTVQNRGSRDARDVQLAFQGTDYLSIIGSTVVHINTINAWTSKEIQITVHVADEAPNGLYCIPVNCSWREYYFDPLQGYVTGPEQNVDLGLSFRVH